LGDCWRVESIEAIAKLKPSLIVGSVPFHPDAVARILTIPAQFLALNPRSLADIETDIETLARISSRVVEGQRLIRRMRSEFAAIAKNGEKFGRRVRVYSEAWPKPRISSPQWVSELIRLCGGEMVVKPGARVTDEEVAAGKPEVILLAWAATGRRASVRTALGNKMWREIPAIRNKHVFVVQDELLNTPGPPLMRGAREVFDILKSIPRKPA
jgi:iron complex transport system substrate-binding protein